MSQWWGGGVKPNLIEKKNLIEIQIIGEGGFNLNIKCLIYLIMYGIPLNIYQILMNFQNLCLNSVILEGGFLQFL